VITVYKLNTNSLKCIKVSTNIIITIVVRLAPFQCIAPHRTKNISKINI